MTPTCGNSASNREQNTSTSPTIRSRRCAVTIPIGRDVPDPRVWKAATLTIPAAFASAVHQSGYFNPDARTVISSLLIHRHPGANASNPFVVQSVGGTCC